MAGARNGRVAALGFRTHSGWACAILAAGRGDRIEIIERRRIILHDTANGKTKQPFHSAEPMSFAKAENYIAQCRNMTEALAREALIGLHAIAERRELPLSGICVIAASGRALPGLRDILASHALIHAAEGEFYRAALAGTAETMGLKATRLKAMQALAHVATQTDMSETGIATTLAGMGKTVGRPWTSDEKLATLAAWSLLAD